MIFRFSIYGKHRHNWRLSACSCRGATDLIAKSLLVASSIFWSLAFSENVPQGNYFISKVKPFEFDGCGEEAIAVFDDEVFQACENGSDLIDHLQIFDLDLNPIRQIAIESAISGQDIDRITRIEVLPDDSLILGAIYKNGGQGYYLHDMAGNYVSTLESDPLNTPLRASRTAQEYFYLSNSGSQPTLFVKDLAGTILKSIQNFGPLPGDRFFCGSCNITVDPSGNIYVRDNSTIVVFDSNGEFEQRFDVMQGNHLIAVNATRIALDSNGRTYDFYTIESILDFDGDVFGTYGHDSFADLLLSSEQMPEAVLFGINRNAQYGALASNGNIYARYALTFGFDVADELDAQLGTVLFKPQYRTFGNSVYNNPPNPSINSIEVRSNQQSIVDIDFQVVDEDNNLADLGALAFLEGNTDIGGVRRITGLIEGTAANVGSDITTNTPLRLTWDASVDLDPGLDFANVSVEILANDGRDPIGFHFITIPSNIPMSGLPQLTMNRSPLTEQDFLNFWFWLVATGDPNVTLSGNQIVGVGGGFDGLTLAQSTTTTSDGRAFIYARLNVREATNAEVTRAKEASTPGVINQFAPRNRAGPIPDKVNEFGFDTGASSGFWVVPL